jgi:hypothetical protein
MITELEYILMLHEIICALRTLRNLNLLWFNLCIQPYDIRNSVIILEKLRLKWKLQRHFLMQMVTGLKKLTNYIINLI